MESEIKKVDISSDNNIKKIKKPVRSKSGITPLTVVLPPRKCNHGTCICPGGDDVPHSLASFSPIYNEINSYVAPLRYKLISSHLDKK